MKHDSTPPIKRLLALPPDLAQQIADYRYSRRVPSESAATRELIRLGLAVSQSQQEAKS